MIGGRECGIIEIPITVWRDVEGNFLSPSFSPNLRSINVDLESTHGADGTADGLEEEDDEPEVHGGEKMQQLALQ